MNYTKETFRPAAVIFDMDGTVIDTEKVFISAWEMAGKLYGYNIAKDTMLHMLGLGKKAFRAAMLEQFGADFQYEQIDNDRQKFYDEEFEKSGVSKKPGLDYLLDCLANAKIPVGLATSRPKERAFLFLNKVGILDKFTAITCGDEIKNGKPAPDIFLLTAERLGQSPSTCVGFEDSTAGLKALAAAGMRSIFIKDLIDPPQEVLATVWHHCHDLAEAVPLLQLNEN